MDVTQEKTQPLISIIIPVHNGLATLSRCLEAVAASTCRDFECIVVDDGSTDATPTVAAELGAQVLSLTNGPWGPAYARNQGAKAAKGSTLFFIDADVVIYPDTLNRIIDSFQQHPQIEALFGSYDDLPGSTGFLSQYRNLQHHFVHQQGATAASTFWSGCGAIHRETFLELNGFDYERFPRPSIEDIDLGYRLRARDGHILLEKKLQVKHLKEWTLSGMLRTDIFDRAIPWTRLIMQAKNLPNDLNLGHSQKLSAALAGILVLFVLANSFRLEVLLLPLLTVSFLSLIDSWQWQAVPQRFVRSGPVLLRNTILLLGLGIIVGIIGLNSLFWPFGVIVVGLLICLLIPAKVQTAHRVCFSAVMLAVGVLAVMLLASYPWWLSLPILGTMLLVVALNFRFYQFFWQQRGPAFAFATLPLQLLYYLYSTASFVFVSGQHFWESNLRPNVAESVE